ncbi:MAG: aminotransferase class IV [Bacteroidota bacterium]
MRFIESILFKDGVYHNLDLHQQRIDRTINKFLPKTINPSLLALLPQIAQEGTHKVRVTYDLALEDVIADIQCQAYYPKKVESLEVTHTKALDYSFKYENRDQLQVLLERSTADDIIIAVNNRITDGSYFNLVFWDGSKWLTPKKPLLHGVRRERLLIDGKIEEAAIFSADLQQFESVSLINAMLDLGELIVDMGSVKQW